MRSQKIRGIAVALFCILLPVLAHAQWTSFLSQRPFAAFEAPQYIHPPSFIPQPDRFNLVSTPGGPSRVLPVRLPSRKRTSTFKLALAGVGGFTVGTGVGLLIGGYPWTEDDSGGSLEIPAYLFTGLAGELLGTPAGVHLANGRRGNYLQEVLASIGIFSLGVMALQFDDSINLNAGNVGQAFYLVVPVGQIAATIALERRAGER